MPATITNEKDLGVNVDANLTFEHHVEIVVNKANRMLGMIRRAYTFEMDQHLQSYIPA